MKKILVFSLAYYPKNVSGAEYALREITDRILPHDITFHIITLRFHPEHPSREHIGNAVVHRVGYAWETSLLCAVPPFMALAKILFSFRAALYAKTLHRTERFDGVWAMMTYMLLPTVLLKTFGVTLPHVLTLQDGDPYEKVFNRLRIRPFISLIDRGFQSARVIQVISAFLGTWPAKRGYLGEVVKIPNGADPGDVHNSVPPASVATLAERLGKKPGEVFLVNTARLEYQKGFDVVVRALTLLPTHIKFLIVGSGTEDVRLHELVQTLNVADRVVFVPQVSREEVTAYRKVSDIFVAPSRSEGLGNAFLSAMASEIPVVATQVGGLAEFVFDRAHNSDVAPTAWVVPPDSPEAIANAVLEILAHPDEVRRVTSYARTMVLERFDWDTIARDMRHKVFEPLFVKNV